MEYSFRPGPLLADLNCTAEVFKVKEDEEVFMNSGVREDSRVEGHSSVSSSVWEVLLELMGEFGESRGRRCCL